jgi:hypothetical protein
MLESITVSRIFGFNADPNLDPAFNLNADPGPESQVRIYMDPDLDLKVLLPNRH